jgi:hypothetical protein
MTAAVARRPRRWAVIVVAAIGLGLIVAPFAFQMFTRAPKGANMIAGFKPYMTDARLQTYQTEIHQIDAAVHEVNTIAAAALTSGSGTPGLASRFPDVAAFSTDWPPVNASMSSMLTTIRANVGNYNDVVALPTFTLFPWFFVIPGLLILTFAAAALIRPAWWSWVRWVLVVLGIGLVLAPVAFQMFTRAPAGGRMVDAFRTIETQSNVQQIQRDFGTIASGEGAIQLELVPALRASGLSDAQIASRYPAITTLEHNWVPILNDFTPMIGAMSDNVSNYEAVKALPPFPLFPWFFVLPGVLICAFVLLARPGRTAPASVPVPASPNTVSEGGP